MVEIHGEVSPGFEPVADVFARHFESAGEVGASLCVYRGDEVVVDLWGGVADPERGVVWTADTLVNVFSVSKGLVALALLRLEDRGELDLDVVVADVWPEFAQAGKASITLRQILNHTSGVVAVDQPLSLADVLAWEPVERAVAAQAPLWEPGTDQGYHMVTWGLLVRAVVPRLVGRSIGELLRDEVAVPLDADVHLGLPDPEHERVASLQSFSGAKTALILGKGMVRRGMDGRFFRNTLLRRSSPGARAAANPRELGVFGLKNFETPEVRRAELPWANVHATARGIARAYAPAASGGTGLGVEWVSAEAAARPVTAQSWSECDQTIRKPLGFSQGFVKEEPGVFSPNRAWFGHPGTGGHLGFADPEAGISLGYTMNRLRPNVRSPTARALSRAVYDCLGVSWATG